MSLLSRSIRFGAVKAARLLKCEHMSLRYCIPAARTQCPQAGRPSNNRSFCARLPQGQTNFDHAPPFGNLRCTIPTTNSTPLSPLSRRMALLAGGTEETRNAVAQFLRTSAGGSAVTEIRIIEDAIELDGVTVARLVPGLRPSLRDELIWAFDSLDEDYIALLEDRIAKLEEQLKTPAR